MKNIAFVLLLLSIFCVGGLKFYLPKFVDSRVRSQIHDATAVIQKKNDQLSELISSLEVRQQKLENIPPECKVVSNFKVDLDRWNCWCDLKDKLRQGHEYSKELMQFRKVFSDYSDLLKMVDSIVADENNETKNDSLTNNLLKFVRIRNVDENKLDRITGYILLLSIRKAGTNE